MTTQQPQSVNAPLSLGGVLWTSKIAASLCSKYFQQRVVPVYRAQDLYGIKVLLDAEGTPTGLDTSGFRYHRRANHSTQRRLDLDELKEGAKSARFEAHFGIEWVQHKLTKVPIMVAFVVLDKETSMVYVFCDRESLDTKRRRDLYSLTRMHAHLVIEVARKATRGYMRSANISLAEQWYAPIEADTNA